MELLAHREAGDAEPAGGFGLVAVGQLDGAGEDFPLGGPEEAIVGVSEFAALGGGKQLIHVFAQGQVRGPGQQGRAGEGSANVVNVDGVALGGEEDFADEVFQFADVAGPVLRLEKGHGLGVDGGIGDAEFDGVFA